MALNKLSIILDGEMRNFWQDGTTSALLRRRWGTLSIPALSISLSYGATSGLANWAYYASRTVNATTADNLDLSGSLTDGVGNTISATKLKLLVVSIASPDGTKTLRIGPRGESNAAQLNFGGVTATDYQAVTTWHVIYEPVAGYTITAGTGDILGIYNSSASNLTYSILMAGV